MLMILQSVIEKKKTLTASELRKKKKDRMARRKRGEEFSLMRSNFFKSTVWLCGAVFYFLL